MGLLEDDPLVEGSQNHSTSKPCHERPLSDIENSSKIIDSSNRKGNMKYKLNLDSWMSSLPDGTPLNEITLPGTHNSAAFYEILSGTTTCQHLSISQQLQVGVRVLDIRVALRSGRLAIYHGVEYQRQWWEDVLWQIMAFLDCHPSETILLCLKAEHRDNNRLEVEDLIHASFSEFGRRVHCVNKLPCLGEVRGGVVLLQRYHVRRGGTREIQVPLPVNTQVPPPVSPVSVPNNNNQPDLSVGQIERETDNNNNINPDNNSNSLTSSIDGHNADHSLHSLSHSEDGNSNTNSGVRLVSNVSGVVRKKVSSKSINWVWDWVDDGTFYLRNDNQQDFLIQDEYRVENVRDKWKRCVVLWEMRAHAVRTGRVCVYDDDGLLHKKRVFDPHVLSPTSPSSPSSLSNSPNFPHSPFSPPSPLSPSQNGVFDIMCRDYVDVEASRWSDPPLPRGSGQRLCDRSSTVFVNFVCGRVVSYNLPDVPVVARALNTWLTEYLHLWHLQWREWWASKLPLKDDHKNSSLNTHPNTYQNTSLNTQNKDQNTNENSTHQNSTTRDTTDDQHDLCVDDDDSTTRDTTDNQHDVSVDDDDVCVDDQADLCVPVEPCTLGIVFVDFITARISDMLIHTNLSLTTPIADSLASFTAPIVDSLTAPITPITDSLASPTTSTLTHTTSTSNTVDSETPSTTSFTQSQTLSTRSSLLLQSDPTSHTHTQNTTSHTHTQNTNEASAHSTGQLDIHTHIHNDIHTHTQNLNEDTSISQTQRETTSVCEREVISVCEWEDDEETVQVLHSLYSKIQMKTMNTSNSSDSLNTTSTSTSSLHSTSLSTDNTEHLSHNPHSVDTGHSTSNDTPHSTSNPPNPHLARLQLHTRQSSGRYSRRSSHNRRNSNSNPLEPSLSQHTQLETTWTGSVREDLGWVEWEWEGEEHFEMHVTSPLSIRQLAYLCGQGLGKLKFWE